MKKAVTAFFYGNYFVGFCAAVLAIEATLQQQLSLQPFLFYIILFLGTVYFYTYAYISKNNSVTANPRTQWYQAHAQWLQLQQRITLVAILVVSTVFFYNNVQAFGNFSFEDYLLLFILPLGGLLYYGLITPKFILRNNGWIKPFVIGFVWAGAVTIYPLIFDSVYRKTTPQYNLLNLLLFIKNGMFISLLAIMFDIKDYAADHNQSLKTFVVSIGLRKTIFAIIIPLCVIGLGNFLFYGITHHFSLRRIFFNTIPFVLLITVAWSLHRRKTILYYLAIIDGLMLLKAICGIAGMIK